MLLVPPQINRFYIMDLAPKRSLTEYAVARGVPVFHRELAQSRSPTIATGASTITSTALKEALDAVCEITGSRDRNLLGVCAGGITSP